MTSSVSAVDDARPKTSETARPWKDRISQDERRPDHPRRGGVAVEGDGQLAALADPLRASEGGANGDGVA
jgi:hypothetical protein